MTGGKYFRATSAEGLEQIYAEIDQLEKTEIEVTSIKRYSEEFRRFAFLGLFFLGLEISKALFNILRYISTNRFFSSFSKQLGEAGQHYSNTDWLICQIMQISGCLVNRCGRIETLIFNNTPYRL